MPVDPAFTLAEHVCQTTFAALSASAVRATKRDVLDTLGAALGGSVADAQRRAYAEVAGISWPGEFHRHDIGWRAIARETRSG